MGSKPKVRRWRRRAGTVLDTDLLICPKSVLTSTRTSFVHMGTAVLACLQIRLTPMEVVRTRASGIHLRMGCGQCTEQQKHPVLSMWALRCLVVQFFAGGSGRCVEHWHSFFPAGHTGAW